jgi:hypothetical protein
LVAGTKFWVQAIPRHQAVWPSKSPVLGIFFSCCGVIFAMTARYTARPEFSAGALVLGSRSSSRVSRGISCLHADALNFFASWNDPGLLRTTIDRLLDHTFGDRPCVKARLTKLFSHTRKKHSGDRPGWWGGRIRTLGSGEAASRAWLDRSAPYSFWTGLRCKSLLGSSAGKSL